MGCLKRLAIHMPQHPFENKEQTFATRINHTRLFEDWEQLRRIFDCLIRGFDCHFEDLYRILRGPRKLLLLRGQLP